MHSKAAQEVTSSRGCAGVCQLDPASCDTFVYDAINRICYLGKTSGSYSFIGQQPDAAGFLDVGEKIWGPEILLLRIFSVNQCM